MYYCFVQDKNATTTLSHCFCCKWRKRKEKKGLRGKEMIKKMFPLYMYMFGSRERKEKRCLYIFYLFGLQKKKNVFFTFIPTLSRQVSKVLKAKLCFLKLFSPFLPSLDGLKMVGLVHFISFPFPPFLPTKLQKNNSFSPFLFPSLLFLPFQT